MRQFAVPLAFLLVISCASAAGYLGKQFNPKAIPLCVTYGCTSTGTKKSTWGSQRVITYSYKLKKVDSIIEVSVGERGTVISIEAKVLRTPMTVGDESFMMKFIQGAAGVQYRPAIMQKCFDKLSTEEATTYDDGTVEYIMAALGSEHIGIKCSEEPLGNSFSSNIWVFYGD